MPSRPVGMMHPGGSGARRRGPALPGLCPQLDVADIGPTGAGSGCDPKRPKLERNPASQRVS
jgi:hypothetical protein